MYIKGKESEIVKKQIDDQEESQKAFKKKQEDAAV